MALPSCRCVGAYPNWKLLGPIVAAARTWAGESPDLHCFDNRPIIDQLKGLYCATLTVSGGGGGGGATLLASFYIPEIVDSFERSQAAGYSGSGDADPFQREAAVDVLRSSHYQSGISEQLVILEDDPTECALVAPGVPSVTPGAGLFSATFAAIPVTVSLLRYEFRLDSAGGWTSNGTSTTITDAPASSGTHVLNVRAVCTSGIAGDEADSAPFDVTAGTITFLDSASADGTGSGPTTTGAIDTTGASFLVAALYWVDGATSVGVSDSKGNTWTPLTDYGSPFNAQLFYAANPVVGAAHTFTANGSAIFSGIVAAAFMAVNVAPFDDESGANAAQPGSLVPSGDGELFVACWGRNDGTTLTIDSGFTIASQTNYVPALGLTVALAYKIQTTGGAENPTTNTDGSVAMAAFLPA